MDDEELVKQHFKNDKDESIGISDGIESLKNTLLIIWQF